VIRPRVTNLVLLICLILSACVSSQREKTIKTTLISVNALRDGFIKYDGEHQAEIVEKATSLEAGTAALATYRAQREDVLKAFVLVYHAISAAVVLNDDDKSLAEVLDKAKLLKQVIDAITKPKG
jgi:hypothetical protein